MRCGPFTVAGLALVIALSLAGVRVRAETPPAETSAGRIAAPASAPAAIPQGLLEVEQSGPPTAVPENAAEIFVTPTAIEVEGANVFPRSRLESVAAKLIGRRSTLADVYGVARAITELYRSHGYFLSLAYLPPQKAEGGRFHIQVVEGRVVEVELAGGRRLPRILAAYAARLTRGGPTRLEEVESVLLRINALPGYAFRGVLARATSEEEGAVKLVLVPHPRRTSVTLALDNYASRYLGPQEATATATTSLLPGTQTSLTLLSGVPSRPLQFVQASQAAALGPDLIADASASLAVSRPAASLKSYDIKSEAETYSAGVSYAALEDRARTLTLHLHLEAKDVRTTLLGAEITNDQIRALRASADGSFSRGGGGDVFSVTLSRGLDGLGASPAGSPTASRPGARPDYWRLEGELTHDERFAPGWTFELKASGQLATAPLYVSEQFGYGGQAFGRAFDPSAFTGDQGFSLGAEMRYDAVVRQGLRLQPFGFVDGGYVEDRGDQESPKRQTAQSLGFGARIGAEGGRGASLELAWPLSARIGQPIYDQNHRTARIGFQLTQSF